MDTSHYNPNALNNNSPYGNLPGISPHQLQQNSSLPQHTLPPLQAPQHAMQNLYGGSAPHTPRTPATPNTPGSANGMGFPQMQAQQQQQRQNQMMYGNNGYQQTSQGYRTSGPMMTSGAPAMSHPQPIAPAPTQNRLAQPLRPMPQGGLQHLGGMQSPYQNNMMMPEIDPPTHVVGSQGRRGILPSAPGRPPVSGTGTGKNAMIPAKDADGKFPCPHCTKTYLHAKHLKRHLLRHTGDRPYMCVLCRDTFSRSDILKRHFQKCSIRRGNPTGASHLSHAQAHLKKSHPGPHKSTNSMSNENDLMGANGMAGQPSGIPLFGVIPDGSVPDAGSNLTDEQAEQLSRSNSMKQLNMGAGHDGRGMNGPGVGGSNRGSFDQGYAGGIASTMPPGMNTPLSFSIPQGQNTHSYSQGYDYASHGNGSTMQSHPSTGQNWSQMFAHNTPQNHHNAVYNPYATNSQVSIKSEPSLNHNTHFIKTEPSYIKSDPSLNHPTNGLSFSGVYPGLANGITNPPQFAAWNLQSHPLEEISARLLYFCFPNNQIIGRSNDIRKYLSADNIKHFLEQFSSFQGHFPVIHIPTFRVADAYDGLLLGMICIGAVYSDRMTPTQVREMMELAKVVIERNSQVFAVVSREQTGDSGFGGEIVGSSKSELEQITAVFMMQVLFTWHGTPLQREKARREFPLVAELARRAGLTRPMTTTPFSVLHQANVTVENFSASSFDWNAWVEQEKRSRLMYTVFLLDAAMVLYFNAAPLFEKDEIRIPLPADDAAWDAPSASDCASALGLHGAAAARTKNSEGSQRKKQPEMHTALKALMDYNIHPGTTNLYSKFILVHALHVQLWSAQRQASLQESGQPLSFPSSGASTPIMQHDWVRTIDPTGSGSQSANTSGRATPDSLNHSSQTLKAINGAFDKWKKNWDEDMAIQYPPSSTQYRRFGFCRDAVHFYWLAKYLMKSSRGLDWQMAPDQRFAQVMGILKSVKTWVVSDSAKRGEELGSVADIDKDFGVVDLTLNMASLFRPLDRQVNSPIPSVNMNIGGGMA
ncbi:related to regulatory protein amdA [Phialocephala subalpina]|jgi:hypothetical protein|uniref:Related to regulatory protein amdA n=1 Tax=Phialocephala subalpina TaxID=576137 RepID=A0A1L7XBP1_9HELO|nr:related to regulatory protein amdA [Phialocephala subalpina]